MSQVENALRIADELIASTPETQPITALVELRGRLMWQVIRSKYPPLVEEDEPLQ